VHDQVLNVGRNADNRQVREIAEAVCRAVPNSELTYANTAGPDPRSYQVDFGQVQRLLPEFRPRWTLESGIAQLVAAFHEARLTAEMYQAQEFTRLARIKSLLSAGAIDSRLRWTDARLPAAVPS
jgi:hypothetical protein